MLILSFFLACIALVLQSTSILLLPIHPFLPWIALTILRKPTEKKIYKPLWLSNGAGIISDLLSNHPLGLHPIVYTMTAFILWQFRNRFLYQRPLHLGLFTLLASLITSILHLFFLFLFDLPLKASPLWIGSDIAAMAIFDGIYALAWFSLPLFTAEKLKISWAKL